MYCPCPCHYSRSQAETCPECADKHPKPSTPPGIPSGSTNPFAMLGFLGGPPGDAESHFWIAVEWRAEREQGEWTGKVVVTKIACGDCGQTKDL